MNILKRAKNNLVYVYHRKRRDLAVYRVNLESLRKCHEAKLYNKQKES